MYATVYKKMVTKLSLTADQAEKMEARPRGRIRDSGRHTSASLPSTWLDIDSAVSDYCKKRRLKKPSKLDELINLHIRAMEEWLGAL
jgi:hypothetical protein